MPEKKESHEPRKEPVDRTPTKAEGDEKTVDEALRNQEKKTETKSR
jgi:hypothetical protein